MRSCSLAGALLALLATGCGTSAPAEPLELPTSGPAATASAGGPISCPREEPWTIGDPRVTESSGIARSPRHPGVLYTHNDRGGPPHLFAIDASGTRAVLRLEVPAVDWEDVASTPDGRLWVADTGDNEGVRESVQVSVVDEPDVLVSSTATATTYDLRYPDGPQDAEALLVDPRDDRVWIVTKDEDVGRVYVAPAGLDERRSSLLQYIGPAPANVTGGDFSPDGELVVLRNQGRAFFSRGFRSPMMETSLPPQEQGESVTFTDDGRHVLVGSEGADSPIHCVPTPAIGR